MGKNIERAAERIGGYNLVSSGDATLFKRVKISSKRQISIPKEFFDSINFGTEAIIEMVGNTLIIKPLPEDSVDFSAEILKELVQERGLSGNELIEEFTRIKQGLPSAINKLINITSSEPTITSNTSDYLASLLEEEN